MHISVYIHIALGMLYIVECMFGVSNIVGSSEYRRFRIISIRMSYLAVTTCVAVEYCLRSSFCSKLTITQSCCSPCREFSMFGYVIAIRIRERSTTRGLDESPLWGRSKCRPGKCRRVVRWPSTFN